MTKGQKAMTGMRGGYIGTLMFGALGSMMGLALGGLPIAAGLLMGRKALKDEQARQLALRRNGAKNAVRRYVDEVQFMAGKDSRDTLRRVQRQLRDYYTARAEELQRSLNDAIAAAQKAAQSDQQTRTQRLREVDAELTRIQGLRKQAREHARDGHDRLGYRVTQPRLALIARVRGLLEEAERVYRDHPEQAHLAEARRRLDEPLRVALAGRVKAGKSTLLNALVGERLAPTDEGECTRIVTWYQEGVTYQVEVVPRDGEPRVAPFTRRRRRADPSTSAVSLPKTSRASTCSGRRRRCERSP